MLLVQTSASTQVGVQEMRVQPKMNHEVNEEWISDKTRFAYDLKFHDTLGEVKADEIQAIAGHLKDTESIQ